MHHSIGASYLPPLFSRKARAAQGVTTHSNVLYSMQVDGDVKIPDLELDSTSDTEVEENNKYHQLTDVDNEMKSASVVLDITETMMMEKGSSGEIVKSLTKIVPFYFTTY